MESNFISFKNSLFMWCKKRRNHEIYISNHKEDGLNESKINFLTKTYTSKKMKTIKEAEENVCCQMLIDLCLLPANYIFDIKDCFFIPQFGDPDFVSYEYCLKGLSNYSTDFKPTFSINASNDKPNSIVSASLTVNSFRCYLETNNHDDQQIEDKLSKKALEILGLITGCLDSTLIHVPPNELDVKIVDSFYEEVYHIKCSHGNCISCNIQCELKENVTNEMSSEIHHKIQWEEKINSSDEYAQLINDIEKLETEYPSKTHKLSFSDNESISKELTSLNSSKLSLDSNTEFGMTQKRFLNRLKKLDETIINYENNFRI